MSGVLLFVGLDNPQSDDPRYALFPHPSGCAGHRLFQMMLEVDEYFDRAQYTSIPKTNLFPVGPCPKSSKKKYLIGAGLLLIAQMKNRKKRVVLFGNEVRDAIWYASEQNFDFDKPMKWVTIAGSDYAWVPHPSGRNHYYNDTRRRRRVGRFLQEARKIG